VNKLPELTLRRAAELWRLGIHEMP
jgi:hypothetical protein